MKDGDLLQSAYHRILPADLRGRLGFGSLLSRWRDRREHRLVGTLACHAPFSSGDVRQRCALTLDAAAHCYDDLLHFIEIQSPGWRENRIIAITDDGDPRCQALGECFRAAGSDKASAHAYHLLYGKALKEPASVAQLLEIGIGTTNPRIVSNMTEKGVPGASLRAWRNWLPTATIHGADIDQAILFEDFRIHTYFVDQLDRNALQTLLGQLPPVLDVIIDDGLHSASANLRSIEAFLKRCRPTGWMFVEDIYDPQVSFFLVLSWILARMGIESCLYRFSRPGMVFAISPGRPLELFPA